MPGVWSLARSARVVVLLVSLLLASSVVPSPLPVASAQGSVQIEWLGHLFYRLTSPQGVVLITSPWLQNPDGPVSLDELQRTDFILVPNAHHEDFGGFDDMGNPLEIAAVSGATVLAPAPLGLWLIDQGLGPSQFRRAAPGDRFTLQNLGFTIGPSAHDNTLPTGADGGPAASYFVTFENGFTVFFNGHSTLVGDLATYASLYQPDLAILGLTPPTVNEFAYTARLLATASPRLRTIIPSHTRPGAPVLNEARQELERLGLGHLLFTPELRTVYEY